MPEAGARDRIHALWWARRKDRLRSPPGIDEYLDLHNRFPQFTFATLNAVINEFEK
jgi:hypothetical protein